MIEYYAKIDIGSLNKVKKQQSTSAIWVVEAKNEIPYNVVIHSLAVKEMLHDAMGVDEFGEPSTPSTPFENFGLLSLKQGCSRPSKKMRTSTEDEDYNGDTQFLLSYPQYKFVRPHRYAKGNSDLSDPFAFANLLGGVKDSKYGSVTEELKEVSIQSMNLKEKLREIYNAIGSPQKKLHDQNVFAHVKAKELNQTSPHLGTHQSGLPISPRLLQFGADNVVVIPNEGRGGQDRALAKDVILLSDDEEGCDGNPQAQVSFWALNHEIKYHQQCLGQSEKAQLFSRETQDDPEKSDHTESKFGDDAFMGHDEDGQDAEEADEHADIWKEMTLALECSKNTTSENAEVSEEKGECNHSCTLEDDLGYVCQFCGVVQKRIETIFDFQWGKSSKSTRLPILDSQKPKGITEKTQSTELPRLRDFELDLTGDVISIHPRHMNEMKPHQIEGFNFLRKNLLTDKPGGCILAHAPGSGKTFLIISFLQSFLAKYPEARPLIVLPKGILHTWLKEFKKWQVENIPLFDMYSSSKSEARSAQLEVLRMWQDEKSILFLGYKQFASIVCDDKENTLNTACQDILLKVPGLLILDEGHTPRNSETDILHSLSKVQTPRKVVLSGTLFQNHVQEVFNILDLVRPNYLKTVNSRAIVKRLLSRVPLSGGSKRKFKAQVDKNFCDLIEDTLQSEDMGARTRVLQDLRELTGKVLHYYKGDFLDELPGLIDFTVMLELSPRQKDAINGLQKLETKGEFKRRVVSCAVCMHPSLEELSKAAAASNKGGISADFNKALDEIISNLNVDDGVKTKFVLNILSQSEATGEKLLVFSQYRLPLIFLERLVITRKRWLPGREIFQISGDSGLEEREECMEKFNNSPDARVLFGSIKACGEGISLVGANRVIILDVHLNPSVTRQAVSRAFRPGQKKKVYTYRLVSNDSAEKDDHYAALRKELISKVWFEWSGLHDDQAFQMDEVDVNDCDDDFFENASLREMVKALYKR
ncbi:protein CHROMATIN REMODELING 35 isoform X2 [Amborella trichopoda]|uniref:protein CHROMATIN REMODELING 35 isoform X2 n=1 Tax=Amborella trichopoda TaxID=13333 RepID=UPI0009C0FA9C|nr:protein CHROMATIN REMODELING 35 isoform X2 [Amborella trichopoda]|eukprot:XP_020519983.1 protein CHROMATIN REMODELING 35 isoform X2 [Amborella trichopoda]